MRRLLLLLAFTFSASAADLGTVAFPTSATNPKAQAQFERGVAALHSFWYEEAANAFRAARELEPSFAMAYWGEAMTHNHPIWMEQDRDAARAILEALPKDAGNAREREWLATLDTLYGEGDKRTRDTAYEQSLGALAAKYPDDLEAQAFHALAILGTMNRDPDDARKQIRAAAILEPLYARAPEHPGVLHYSIHAYDDPLHAPLGLRTARRYARVAPSAHHALHMPSHIFLQLGMWDEAAKSNEEAYAASVAWVERAKLPSAKRDLHSLTWLHYIYLQQDRREDAKRLLAEVSGEKAMSERERSTRTRMLAAWAVETGEPVDVDGTGNVEDNAQHCAAGYPSTGDTALFAKALNAIHRGELDAANVPLSNEVMQWTVKAMAERKRGNLTKAIEHAQRAVALEDAAAAPSGPPDVLKPSHELLGELLAAAGRCEESQDAFRKSLLRTPNRRLSLRGAPCNAARVAAATSITPASPYRLLAATVVSPNETGWQLVRSDRFETVFSKRTGDADAVASAKTLQIRSTASEEKLLAELETAKEKELNALPGRKRDSLHFYHVTFRGMPCLQYDGIFPAAGSSGPAFQYFNFRGYRCALPGGDGQVLELQVSNETNVRGFSKSFFSMSDEFFQGVVLPKAGAKE